MSEQIILRILGCILAGISALFFGFLAVASLFWEILIGDFPFIGIVLTLFTIFLIGMMVYYIKLWGKQKQYKKEKQILLNNENISIDVYEKGNYYSVTIKGNQRSKESMGTMGFTKDEIKRLKFEIMENQKKANKIYQKSSNYKTMYYPLEISFGGLDISDYKNNYGKYYAVIISTGYDMEGSPPSYFTKEDAELLKILLIENQKLVLNGF